MSIESGAQTNDSRGTVLQPNALMFLVNKQMKQLENELALLKKHYCSLLKRPGAHELERIQNELLRDACPETRTLLATTIEEMS